MKALNWKNWPALAGIVLMLATLMGIKALPVFEQALGKSGQMMPGDVYRIGMPRSDLNVAVEGVPVKPGFALGSFATFKQMGEDADDVMLMGDLVLLDEE